jgi:hypothetical protein
MLDIRQGDKWMTRCGEVATIDEEILDSCTDYCWKGKCMQSTYTWNDDGKVYRGDISDFDLISLYDRYVPMDTRDSLDFFRQIMGGKPSECHGFET